MVHGKEEGGDARLRPDPVQISQRLQVQAVPTSREKEGGLFDGMLEKATWKIGRASGIHVTSQFQDLLSSRDGEKARKYPTGEPRKNLGPGRSKGKNHATVVEVGQRATQGPET
jgi:hypothetical protein